MSIVDFGRETTLERLIPKPQLYTTKGTTKANMSPETRIQPSSERKERLKKWNY